MLLRFLLLRYSPPPSSFAAAAAVDTTPFGDDDLGSCHHSAADAVSQHHLLCRPPKVTNPSATTRTRVRVDYCAISVITGCAAAYAFFSIFSRFRYYY